MGLSETPPNYSSVARLHVRALINIDQPTALAERRNILNAYGDFFGSNSIIVNPDFPITWGHAHNDDTVIIWLSGLRTRWAFQQIASGLITPTESILSTRQNYRVDQWAIQIWNFLLAAGLVSRPKVVIAGHSLGGAIGLVLAEYFATRDTPPRVWMSSFGSPAIWGRGALPSANATIVRWTNPTDNVPSLPPGEDRAPNLYAALTRAQRYSLSQWRHVCQAYSVDALGAISVIDDPPSTPIGFTTLLAALTSPAGLVGEGHLLPTYLQNLSLVADVEPVTPPPPPVVPVAPPQPAPPIAPIRFSPPVPARVPDNQALDARRTAIAGNAMINDSVQPLLPDPYRVKAINDGGTWSVYWMDYPVALGPTKKKARAVARHLNKLLPIFQGVAECNTYGFVYALADYLNLAADPAGPFSPKLNNGGNPFAWNPPS